MSQLSGIDKWADEILRVPSFAQPMHSHTDEAAHAEARCRAVRAVAANSIDATECRTLLEALGLTMSDVRAARRSARAVRPLSKAPAA